jgi:hypothetical protein
MKYYQLDNDTKKYIKRLSYNGYKTPSDIYSVDQFIRGLKDLGYFGFIHEIWFLRRDQNAGAGTTLFGFKTNTFNGTLINGPTWEAQGIRFISASSQRVDLPNGSIYAGTDDIFVSTVSIATQTSPRQVILSHGNNNSAPDSFTVEGPGSAGTASQISIQFSTPTTYSLTANARRHMLGGMTSRTTIYSSSNGSAYSSTTSANQPNRTGNNCGIGYMRSPTQNYFNGQISYIGIFKTQLNSAAMHNLVASTICKEMTFN